MVDVSYDYLKEIQSGESSYAWKFPSGCAIQDMDNGESMVRIVCYPAIYIHTYMPTYKQCICLLYITLPFVSTRGCFFHN